jgi:hypothetical protein
MKLRIIGKNDAAWVLGFTPAIALRMCVLIAGGIGFGAGFFGPMVFDPTGNQGPLVGF